MSRISASVSTDYRKKIAILRWRVLLSETTERCQCGKEDCPPVTIPHYGRVLAGTERPIEEFYDYLSAHYGAEDFSLTHYVEQHLPRPEDSQEEK